MIAAIEPTLQNALAALIFALIPYIVYQVTRIVNAVKKTEEKVRVLEKQGNSAQEQILRVRKATAERNLKDTPDSEPNRIELQSATMALDTHLRMQDRVDAMTGAKTP